MPPIPAEPTENISIFHPKVLLLSAGVTTSLFSDINFINDTLNELERI